jgi:hypothetical protein
MSVVLVSGVLASDALTSCDLSSSTGLAASVLGWALSLPDRLCRVAVLGDWAKVPTVIVNAISRIRLWVASFFMTSLTFTTREISNDKFPMTHLKFQI